jgi:hypothetical protein
LFTEENAFSKIAWQKCGFEIFKNMIRENFGRKNYFEEFEKFSEKSLVNDLLLHVATGRVGGAGQPSCRTCLQAAALTTFPRPDSFQLCPLVAALHHHTIF